MELTKAQARCLGVSHHSSNWVTLVGYARWGGVGVQEWGSPSLACPSLFVAAVRLCLSLVTAFGYDVFSCVCIFYLWFVVLIKLENSGHFFPYIVSTFSYSETSFTCSFCFVLFF